MYLVGGRGFFCQEHIHGAWAVIPGGQGDMFPYYLKICWLTLIFHTVNHLKIGSCPPNTENKSPLLGDSQYFWSRVPVALLVLNPSESLLLQWCHTWKHKMFTTDLLLCINTTHTTDPIQKKIKRTSFVLNTSLKPDTNPHNNWHKCNLQNVTFVHSFDNTVLSTNPG